ncbi:MAG: right-handed parallel beta-helix repeat-containing protein, partial [Leadbetterella sp.]
MKKILFFLSILFLSRAVVLGQSTIYVSPTGTGDGTSTSSPTSIGGALDITNIAPGTTIILMDGTYNLDGDRYFWVKSGTASSPITIKAQNKHMAILKGNSTYSSSRYGVLYLAGCKHVVVDGLTVMHDSGSQDQQSGINVGTAYGAGANGANIASEYITVKNCKVYNNGTGGIVSTGSDHITFEYNIVYGNATRSPLNGSGISIYKPLANTADSNYWGMI